MEIRWINVGEGDCILLLFSTGHSMVVDIDTWQPLGEGLEDAIEYLRNSLPKNDNGSPRIDLLVSTHPHRDHASGIAKALEEFDVREVWESGHRLEGDEAAEDWYKEFVEAIEGARAIRPKASEDPRLPFGPDIKIWVLSPTKDVVAKNDDTGRKDIHDQCMVLRVEADGQAVILTGDSRFEVWRDFVVPTFGPEGEDLLGAGLLDASHHGSRSFFMDAADEEPYLDALKAVDPVFVVISVGPNTHDHPHDEALDQYNKDGRTVVRTDEVGTVSATTTMDGWQLKGRNMKGALKVGATALAVGIGGTVLLRNRRHPPEKHHRNWSEGPAD
jgi:beta-lactamase superfamily II metal-dependent hydrolase